MATKTKELKIPAPNVGRMVVRIEGKTPLLQNPWTQRVLDNMPGGKNKGKSGKAEKLTPDQEFQEALEALEVPTTNGGPPIYGVSKEAIVHGMASAAYRLGDFKMTEIRAAVSVNLSDDRIPIEAAEPEMDSRAGNLSGRGSVKVVNRPRFYPWALDIPLEFDRGVLNEEAVVRILNDMGRGIGLGSYRPENNGTFGTFEVAGATLEE